MDKTIWPDEEDVIEITEAVNKAIQKMTDWSSVSLMGEKGVRLAWDSPNNLQGLVEQFLKIIIDERREHYSG